MEPASDASSRQASGILTPASDGSLNADDSFNSISRKRKREGDSMGDLLKTSFVVRPYPATVFVKPRTLQPLMLLPRSSLPLSTLDIGFLSDALPQSRLFETHVKILELEQRLGSRPMVLIARLDDGKTCYAVEREDRGLYALCRLGSWVDLSRLKDVAVASIDISFKSEEKKKSINTAFQVRANLEVATPEIKISRNKRLAIEAMQSMIKRPVQDSTPIEQKASLPTPVQSTPIQEEAINVEKIMYAPEDVANEAQPTAQDITNTLRTQYFEALYLSKTSLAFFAKGPLSRARAAFHLDYDSNLEMDDLITFLESLVLSTSIMDKKYKDGVPDLVNTLGIVSDDEANKPPRASRSKRIKPGKNGLYPNEDINIRKWWYAKDQSSEQMGIDDTSDAIAKRRISQLRLRETQLQMIILLEIMALQPQLSKTKPEESLPQSNPHSSPDTKLEKRKKAKKPAELVGLIDLHIDRLCIWESVTSDSKPSEPRQHTKSESNPLRDFCTEVLLPFFSARLPTLIDSLNRKLGGPTSTPARPKFPKASTISTASTTSRLSSSTRQPPQKSRRSLARVLTDERSARPSSRGPSGAISLMRSATAPALTLLKREASETPSLSSIPTATADLRANRGGVLKSKRFSHREVDLSTAAIASEAKAKKAAAVEAELRDAISALKKPNRSLAGKSAVETAERRVAAAAGGVVGGGVRKRKPAVQILATPKGNRYRDADPFISSRSDGLQATIPTSIQRPRASFLSVPSAPEISFTDAERAHAGIEETPCRMIVSTPVKSGLSLPESPHGDDPIASPLFSRKKPSSDVGIGMGMSLAVGNPAETLVVPNSVQKVAFVESIAPAHVLETPSKSKPAGRAALGEVSAVAGNRSTLVTGVPAGAWKVGDAAAGVGAAADEENRESDVYAVLGWDDDYDL